MNLIIVISHIPEQLSSYNLKEKISFLVKRVQQILITKHCLLCTNISICWNRTFLLLKVCKEKNFAVEILQLLRNKTFSLVTI